MTAQEWERFLSSEFGVVALKKGTAHVAAPKEEAKRVSFSPSSLVGALVDHVTLPSYKTNQ